MLCDTAGLSGGYVCLTNRIKKGGFTVVNVAHNAYYRRSGNHVGLVLLILF